MSSEPLHRFIETNNKFQEIIGYTFENPVYLLNAFVSTSYLNDLQSRRKSLHEAYSTFGDAIIDVICMEKAIEKGEDTREGLTNQKKIYASNSRLNRIGDSLNLQDYIVWGKAELEPPVWERSEKVLANYLEALFGAIYLDGGMTAVNKVVEKIKLFN